MTFTFHYGSNINSDEVIEEGIQGGKTEYLETCVDLEAFYKEMAAKLIKKDFEDMIGRPSEMKVGKFFGNAAAKGDQVQPENPMLFNRTPYMFEEFMYWKERDGIVDLEITWKARRKVEASSHGWFEVTLNIANRFAKYKEILDGNQKKKVLCGRFEFRNKMLYKNVVIRDHLNKVPYVKNSKKFKEFYLNYVYHRYLNEDIWFCLTTLKPFVNNVIQKHFRFETNTSTNLLEFDE
ncbi:MAG: hypothetical protein H6500_00525 [Candidatus Woesearchaeota archaeon]|nr:hypothetical protein [Nanoarchaeota archaeon]USN44317.1 MAG: hypothetical protein H6500_00525 [Candidatus Woesearchaeota archaeon]